MRINKGGAGGESRAKIMFIQYNSSFHITLWTELMSEDAPINKKTNVKPYSVITIKAVGILSKSPQGK